MKLFDPDKPPIDVGRVSETGVTVTGQEYSDTPRIGGLATAAGQGCVTALVGRQRVVIATGGFHS